MSIGRFLAIAVIFGGACAAWMILGGSVWARTETLDRSLSREMDSLWGPRVLAQASPYWAPTRAARRGDSGTASPSDSRITADIHHDNRYKGLLWYSTFSVDFAGRYTLDAAPAPGPDGAGAFVFPLPPGVTSYERLGVTVDDAPFEVPPADVRNRRIAVPLARDSRHIVSIEYRTGGQDVWLYVPGDVDDDWARRPNEPGSFARDALCELSDFSLTVTTDFREIDYPKGTRSPSTPASPTDGGMTATWQYDNALTSQAMGLAMPRRANAGPIVARMSFFAPVSLLFFFTVLLTVVVLKRIPLHPMHYLFVAAGFFACHILMAYLADVVAIHAAFWIAAAVSVFLVASYMRLVAGVRFALIYTGLAQLVFLVGFSYAFFWVGRTGLTVTIGAVATLFVLMQATGRVNWNEVLGRREAVPLAPPVAEEAPPKAEG